jgi:hypothetical protein
MANVDPNEVIQDLSIQLAQTNVQLSMTRIALKNTEQELSDANQVIAKHGMAEPTPDGQ